MRFLNAAQASCSELHRLSDESVIACLKAGNNDALAVLFDRYQRLVLSVAARILRDDAEAEDVCQIVFLDIYRAVSQFDAARGTAKVWILQYAYHRSINRRQQLNARGHYLQDPLIEDDPFFAGVQAWGSLSGGESRRLVQQALATLNEKQRMVIESACLEGFSMKQIAERSGDSLVSIRHHYYRGMGKLRMLLTGQSEPEVAPAGQEVADAGA